jgi:photosystem II stability/assembly factor-like uncharacterized protein
MNRATRLVLVLSFAAICFAVVWDFTPRTSSHSKAKNEVGTPGSLLKSQRRFKGIFAQGSRDNFLAESNMNAPVPQPTVTADDSAEADDDPDLPPGMAGKIDKESYLGARGDYIDMLRGREGDAPAEAREKAIREMERQEIQLGKQRSLLGLSALVNTTNWSFLGPAPIPNGQTSSVSMPVSGRTISIAVHPTDPDIVYVGTAQGGLYKSTSGGANWTALFDFQLESLAIGAITIDPTNPNIVYVGTGENGQSADSFAGRGLYIIRNAETATPTLNGPFRLDGASNDVFSGRAIGRVLVNPLDNNVIFVCTSSATGGNPNTTTVLQPRRGIYRSTNAQSATPTFEQIQITGVPTPNDRTTIDIEMDPANPNLLLATVVGITGDGGIYRTDNALDPAPTFTRTLTLPNGATNGRAELTVTRSSVPATTFYAATGETSSAALGGPACAASRSGLMRRSTDLGLTWSTPLPGSTGFCGGQCFYDIAVAVTPDNQTIHLGGAARGGASPCLIDVMKRSTDGGASFARNDVGLHADEHALAIAPSNPNVVYTGSDGGIWRSTNNGTNWISLNNADFSATQFQSVALHPFDRFFSIGGTQDNGTNCLSPDGLTWFNCRGGDGGYTLIDDNAFDTTNVTMYHTFFNQTNSQIAYERADTTSFAWGFRGCSGTVSNNGFRCADNVLFYAPMAQGPGNPNTIYFGTDRLYRSSNKGDTMVTVSQGPLVPTAPGALSGIVLTTIGVSPQDDNVRIVGLRNGQVFATTTGSATLTNITGANFPAPNPIDTARNSIGEAIIDPNNKFTAYVSFVSFSPPAGQQIFKTTNLNDPSPTWTASSNGIPQVPVSSIAIDPQDSNSLYAGTDIGVYHSSDGGANWVPLGTGLPRVAVFDVKISNVQRYLRIATHGRGIWEIGIPGRQLPVIHNGGITITAEGCAPANGVIDPGEDVTVSFGATNIGPGPTENLVVTLLATGGVTFPSGPQNYGVVAPGATGTGEFHFSNNGTCAGTITLTFHLQDGDLDLGNVSIPFTLGLLVNSAPSFTENFDAVTAPALPAGWATAQTGAAPLWVTSTTNDTAPNSAFGGGAATPGDNSLTSPTIAVPAAPATGTNPGVRLTFRNSYNTEGGFDGAVLEISINGGAFADIISAGGSFVEGGYNSTIGVTDSVLTGRAAWTGNSGGFITTTAVLPPTSYGQNAQLRWRTAYDTGTHPTGGGQRVDTISIYASTRICCGGACVLSCPSDIEVSNDPGDCGAVVNYPAPTVVGNCGTVTASQDSGTLFPIGTTPVVITAARLDGTSDSCPFDVKVNDTEFPVVSNPTANPNALWPPDHRLVDITVNYTATDNCPLTCVLTVASNEPINGTGDGDLSPDWVIVDSHHVKLRAERAGTGSGRTYTITVTCTDESGNATVKTTTVFVPLNMKGGSAFQVINRASSIADLTATPATRYTLGPGWITVAAGSYPLNPTLEGKLSFDFSSLTKASTPEALISFSTGKLEFNASKYERVDISGAKAQFEGVGKINGDDGYRFILTVIDGQAASGGGVDKFRIKIWSDNTGEVVFDNQMGDSNDAEPTTRVGDRKSIPLPR